MTIEIRDGWPFIQPALFVEGMKPLEHADADGQVCLWETGDGARQWMHWAGWEDRIAEWAQRQVAGFRRRDATMDAHRYFERRGDELAELDVSTLAVGSADGALGPLRGAWRNKRTLLQLRGARAGRQQEIKGRWFFRRSLSAPPRNLPELESLLMPEQRAALSNVIKAVAASKQRRVVALIWEMAGGLNALVLVLDRDPATVARPKQAHADLVRARALEFAPSDAAILRMRAGPDAAWLEQYKVIIFGAGSLGSHVAVLLAESGIGSLTLVDGERLRPGNVVRHAAPRSAVGLLKVDAVSAVIGEHAPWTTVQRLPESLWEPQQLAELLEAHDFAIDATGLAGFTDQLSLLAASAEEPMVSAALFRDGAIARVRRQTALDRPIIERLESAEFVTIPPGPDSELLLEPGCSAPLTQAAPRTVVACAATATAVVVDSLAGTHAFASEIIDVHRPLGAQPFDRIGRIAHG
jgi:hypothetical protein